MTYRQLAAQIAEISEEHLDDDVTIYVEIGNRLCDCEFYSCNAETLEFQDGDDVLDDGHPFIVI